MYISENNPTLFVSNIELYCFNHIESVYAYTQNIDVGLFSHFEIW